MAIGRCQVLKDKADNKDVKDEETTTTSDSSWPLEDVSSRTMSLKDKVDNKDVKDEETTTTSDSSWPLEDVKSRTMSSSRTR